MRPRPTGPPAPRSARDRATAAGRRYRIRAETAPAPARRPRRGGDAQCLIVQKLANWSPV